MFKFRKKSHQEVLDNIPNHIGIIMDGNGRWAKKRLQPRVMGHKAGMEIAYTIEEVVLDKPLRHVNLTAHEH